MNAVELGAVCGSKTSLMSRRDYKVPLGWARLFSVGRNLRGPKRCGSTRSKAWTLNSNASWLFVSLLSIGIIAQSLRWDLDYDVRATCIFWSTFLMAIEFCQDRHNRSDRRQLVMICDIWLQTVAVGVLWMTLTLILHNWIVIMLVYASNHWACLSSCRLLIFQIAVGLQV